MGFDRTDNRVDRPVSPARAFFRCVLNPELERVHAKFLADLVDHRLHRVRSLRCARSPVSGRLGLVYNDVVSIDPCVRNVVAGENTHHPCTNRGSRVRARVKPKVRSRGRNCAVVLHANLSAHPGTRRRACGFEHGCSFHEQLDRASCLPGENRCDWFEVTWNFTPEAAANLQRNYLH